MPRTTVDIDASLLRRVKRLARARKKSLGSVMSELLAAALGHSDPPAPSEGFDWKAQPMRARVDLEDKEAVYTALERE